MSDPRASAQLRQRRARRRASDGRPADLVNPTTGEVVAHGPGVRRRGRRRARTPRPRAAFETWRDTTPSERQQALLQIADAIEARADEFVDARVREHRQAARADRVARRSRRWSTRSGSSPARPAMLEGRAAGEYMAGPHLVDPARADRRRRPGDAVELPDDDGGLEDRPGARRRQHRRAQAVATPRPRPPLLLAELAAEFLPAGRVQRRHAATATPAGRWSSTRRPQMVVDHRLGARRHGGGRRRGRTTSSACTSSSAARRRSSSSTTPTSRPRPRRIAVAGYFNAGQDCTAATRVLGRPRHPRRLRRGPGRAGARTPRSAAARRRGRARSAR